MPKIWNPESVRLLSDIELQNLLRNARTRQNQEVEALCAEEQQRRKVAAKVERAAKNNRARASKISRARQIEIEADVLLVDLANKLNVEYDLSEAAARALSNGRFRPHRLLAKNGTQSKLGGIKKRGQIAIYRYISYRRNDDIVGLAAVMINKDDEGVFWKVDGPEHLLHNREDRYPELEIDWGVWFAQFSEAEAQFRTLLNAIAPKR
jgi:hypothetical protein